MCHRVQVRSVLFIMAISFIIEFSGFDSKRQFFLYTKISNSTINLSNILLKRIKNKEEKNRSFSLHSSESGTSGTQV